MKLEMKERYIQVERNLKVCHQVPPNVTRFPDTTHLPVPVTPSGIECDAADSWRRSS